MPGVPPAVMASDLHSHSSSADNIDIAGSTLSHQQQHTSNPPKSPPLAFEPTSNDSLAPPIPTASQPAEGTSQSSTMGRLDSPSVEALDLQFVVDQQANAINLLHDAFSSERASWTLERERLYQRIASLERLLKSGDHHSPAKSPALSPASSSAYASPQSRAASGITTLPSIAEDTHIQPLSKRREGAPTSISFPPIHEEPESRRHSTVDFAEDDTPTHQLKVQEIPISPPNARTLSPPPPKYRREAGNTPPLHAIRPPTPPPKNSLSMDGIDDTPTRNNTHINKSFLTRSNDSEDEDGDVALRGPLNLPELPHAPRNETNFTLEMLSKKLERIEQHPDERDSRPGVFAQPSPGLVGSPEEGGEETEGKGQPGDFFAANKLSQQAEEENPFAPVPTAKPRSSSADQQPSMRSPGSNHSPSARLSPAAITGNTNGSPLSPQRSREAAASHQQQQLEQQHERFEQGGIKLKKKPSSNFGAPFGSLGGVAAGFGGLRRGSHD